MMQTYVHSVLFFCLGLFCGVACLLLWHPAGAPPRLAHDASGLAAPVFPSTQCDVVVGDLGPATAPLGSEPMVLCVNAEAIPWDIAQVHCMVDTGSAEVTLSTEGQTLGVVWCGMPPGLRTVLRPMTWRIPPGAWGIASITSATAIHYLRLVLERAQGPSPSP